jgi:hypothetical protein
VVRGIRVKAHKIILIVSFVLAIFVFSGLVSALDTNAISAYPVFSKSTLNIGSSITVRITIQSSVDEQLQITHVGVNFDWMDSSGFFGPNLTNNPVTITSNGSYTTPPFIVQVPTNVTMGSHTYFIGVDGTEGTSQTDFYWNSSAATIIVLAANQTGTTTTPGPTGGGGGGQTTSSPLNTILYIAVIAIVVIVVIAVIVMLMQKRKKTTPSDKTVAKPVAEQPAKPAEDENYSI